MSSSKRMFKVEKPWDRADLFLKKSFPDQSRSQIEKWFERGLVFCNERPVERKNQRLDSGDVVTVRFPPQKSREIHPTGTLSKLYEDEHFLAIEKPEGISVHPGAGHEGEETILDLFTLSYPQVKEFPEKCRPGIIHRLDRDTSGVLLLAKTAKAMTKMQKAFKRREVQKTYLALVHGQLRFLNGTIDAPLIRSRKHPTRFTVAHDEEKADAREAVTEYSVIRRFDQITFVRLFPRTGRTHQLRVHLAAEKHPILGDPIYGKKDSFPRLALHAYSLQFRHPFSGNLITICSPCPQLFRDYVKSLFPEAGGA